MVSNKTVEGQIRIMREIPKEINQYGAKEIYWTVENNSIGEAALVVIRDTGEENFQETFYMILLKYKAKEEEKVFPQVPKSKLDGCIH